jgi:hypothetical protein
MHKVTYFCAAATAVASLALSALVTEIEPFAINVASASAKSAAHDEHEQSDYFPDRFRHVTVWDERPQPEAF